MQQQPLQQPPQQPNLDPMAYAPIAKLDNFTSEEDDTQIWLNDEKLKQSPLTWDASTEIYAKFKQLMPTFHSATDPQPENESNHSESLESEETESEPEKITENEEEMATAYIAKIPEFTGEDNDTSPQEWLDKVQKAGDANGWITARMLKTIPYFLQETAEECNAAVNKQKAITAMYTEAIVEGKLIHLILDSGLAQSIITYQLMQQLK
ncbi:hypothetical protein G9A89_018726 [Geosiphon pyriformis]|nr:hypothetical protein G9A89_018726 [Geosiphon pyriformis]